MQGDLENYGSLTTCDAVKSRKLSIKHDEITGERESKQN